MGAGGAGKLIRSGLVIGSPEKSSMDLCGFEGSMELVTRLPDEEREILLTRFCDHLLETNEQRRFLSFLAATADGELAARVFERACEIRRGLSNAPGQDVPKWELFRQQEDLLKAIAPGTLLDGISHKLEEELESTELEVLTEVLARFNPTTTEMCERPFRSTCGENCTLT